MSQTTLLLSALGSVVTAALYLYIGTVLRGRRVSAEAHLANGMFVLWWLGLGGISLLGASMTVLHASDRLPIWLYQANTSFSLLVLFAALWGLQYYLVYLYTGSRRSFAPLGAFYALLFLATLALVEYAGTPDAIIDNGWSLRAVPRLQFTPLLSLAFVLLLVGPQVIAAAAYARLYRKARDRTQRYRIALVASAILVWFGSSIVATALEASQSIAWQLSSRIIGVLGASTILVAYRPPAWVQRRWGIASLDSKPDLGAPAN